MEDYKQMSEKPEKPEKPEQPKPTAPGGPSGLKIDPSQVGPCWMWIYAFKSMFGSVGSKTVGCFAPPVPSSPPSPPVGSGSETQENPKDKK